MNRLKTDGKIFGYNGFDFSSHTNFPRRRHYGSNQRNHSLILLSPRPGQRPRRPAGRLRRTSTETRYSSFGRTRASRVHAPGAPPAVRPAP
jgi:hypothetical protein